MCPNLNEIRENKHPQRTCWECKQIYSDVLHSKRHICPKCDAKWVMDLFASHEPLPTPR